MTIIEERIPIRRRTGFFRMVLEEEYIYVGDYCAIRPSALGMGFQSTKDPNYLYWFNLTEIHKEMTAYGYVSTNSTLSWEKRIFLEFNKLA